MGRWWFYSPGNRIAWDQGRLATELARMQLSSVEQNLIVRLSKAYFDVLAVRDALEYVQTLKEAVATQLVTAQRNFEVGNTIITDTREAQARFDLAHIQEIAAENDWHITQLALDQLMGEIGTHPEPLAQPMRLPSLQLDQVQRWVDKALEQHPSVSLHRLALDIAHTETEQARTGHFPTVDLQVSVGHSRYPQGASSARTFGGPSDRSTTAYTGVVLNWPIFTGYAIENKVRETATLEEKKHAELDEARRTVT